MRWFKGKHSHAPQQLTHPAEHGDGTGIHVILAIGRRGGEDLSLISKLGRIFGDLFGSHEHLDMMFVGEDEERELQKV